MAPDDMLDPVVDLDVCLMVSVLDVQDSDLSIAHYFNG